MAKLEDLLAQHVAEWPECAEYARQDGDKEVCFRGGDDSCVEHDFFLDVMADDACVRGVIGTTKVYKHDWLSARARLHADSANGQQVSGVLEVQEIDTDQALWDKVAVAALAKSIGTYPDDSTSEQVRYCFEYADAFMAERAKRMKGGV